MQGTWTVAAFWANGEPIPNEKRDPLTFVFEKDDMRWNYLTDDHERETATFRIKLDASAKPHHLDMTQLTGPEPDLVIQGVYEIKGDDLKVCMPLRAQEGEMAHQLFPREGLGQPLLVIEAKAGEVTRLPSRALPAPGDLT
jgi:uncharacterized protein (TIGR03067 family)